MEWEAHKDVLEELFRERDLTLSDIMNFMKECYNFSATRAQYAKKFSEWGFKRNLSRNEWIYIGQCVKKTAAEGKESEVFYRGERIPEEKVKKRTRLNAPTVVERFTRNGALKQLEGNENIRISTPTLSDNSLVSQDPLSPSILNLASSYDVGSDFPDFSHLQFSPQITAIDSDTGWVEDCNHLHMSVIEDALEPTERGAPQNISVYLEEFSPWLHNLPSLQFRRQLDAIFSDNPFKILREKSDQHSIAFTMLLGTCEEAPAAYPSPRILGSLLESHVEGLLGVFQMPNFPLLRYINTQNYENLLSALLQVHTPTISAVSAVLVESAARLGKHRLLRLLIDSGADSTRLTGNRGYRLLQSAASKNEIEVAQLLVDCGAAVDSQAVDGPYGSHTPLHLAIAEGHVDMVKFLLAKGADREKPQRYAPSYTPLQWAMYHHRHDIIKLLIEAGTDVYKITTDLGLSALEYAFLLTSRMYRIVLGASRRQDEHPNCPAIFELAEQGPQQFLCYIEKFRQNANADIETMLEEALCKASQYDRPEIVASLLEIGVDPDTRRVNQRCPLLCAVKEANTELAEILLCYGADPNAEGVLRAAAFADSKSLVLLALLVDRGANVAKHGGEVVQDAVYHGFIEVVKFLVSSGAALDAPRNPYLGKTTLQLAVHSGNIDMVQYLLDSGADVNAPASPIRGRTALQIAAEAHDMEMIKFLLNNGADVNAPPAKVKGATALQASLGDSDESTLSVRLDIFQILLAAGADITSSAGDNRNNRNKDLLCSLARAGDADLVQLVVDAGANLGPVICRGEGRTPLQAAAEGGHLEVAKVLLAAGSDVNAPAAPFYGRTALQAAASSVETNLDLIHLLLDAGADVHAPACLKGGVTALQGASICGHLRLALLLLEKGADVNAPASPIEGRTAIEGAAEHGRLDMVRILLNARNGISRPDRDEVQRAISLAKQNGHPAVVGLLEGHST
ncbi:uncharacterized protein PAC_14618 [Aspergillus udagawae]|nr:uncharacterized protein PAC_14618 [Aspergillus udagawae]